MLPVQFSSGLKSVFDRFHQLLWDNQEDRRLLHVLHGRLSYSSQALGLVKKEFKMTNRLTEFYSLKKPDKRKMQRNFG